MIIRSFVWFGLTYEFGNGFHYISRRGKYILQEKNKFRCSDIQDCISLNLKMRIENGLRLVQNEEGNREEIYLKNAITYDLGKGAH